MNFRANIASEHREVGSLAGARVMLVIVRYESFVKTKWSLMSQVANAYFDMSSDREKESSNCGYSGCDISSIGRRSSMERKEGR